MAGYRRWGAPTGGGLGGSSRVLGVSMPKTILWLIAATVLTTCISALVHRNVFPILDFLLLVPAHVMHGQVWRLVTWVLIGGDPIGLLFGCLLLYWIGPDLVNRWGTPRFLATYFGGAALIGIVTCAIGHFLWVGLDSVTYMGQWPMNTALIIAWAALFPDRPISMFFVLPMQGRNLIIFEVGFTVVFAMIFGLAPFVPHFIAEALAVFYMDVVSVRKLYLRGRMAMLQREYDKRTAHLRVVQRDRDKHDEPPRWTH